MKAKTLTALVGISFALACGDSTNDGQGGAGGANAAPDGSSSVDASSGVGGGNADAGNGGSGNGGSGNGGSGHSGGGGNAGSGGHSGGAGSGGNSDSGGGDASGIDARSAADGASSDSRSIADAADGSSRACGGVTCAATEVCVAYRVIGGVALRPDDAGNCRAGAHPEGTGPDALCAADFAYRCMPLMGCASMPVSCSCAATPGAETPSTCPNAFPVCFNPAPATWLDPAAQLICELLAP